VSMDDTEATSPVTSEYEARFVAEFVEHSSKARDQFEQIWQETLQNYLVRPYTEGIGYTQSVNAPLYTGRRGSPSSTTGYAVLKDPESNQIVESLVSDEMILQFADGDYVRSKPVGGEDTGGANTVNRLLHYNFRLEGHYRAMMEWKKDSKIFGLGIMESYWDYREQPRAMRSIQTVAGQELSSESYMMVPVYDDVKMRPVDLFDFFWDPGASRIIDMLGCAKRFTVTKAQARAKAKQLGPDGKPIWSPKAVEKAILNKATSDSREKRDKMWREGLDRPQDNKSMPAHGQMVGYCYYGEVPYETSDGIKWRRIEVLCGERVRSEPWYHRIPFFEEAPAPIQGRFPGIAPLEVIRFSQDFADSILMLTADGAAIQTHPPHIVDRYAEVELSKLRRFRRDTPILANRTDAVQTVPYNPNMRDAYTAYQQSKQHMREGSGALGPLQGLSDGPDRESATGFSGRYKAARGRPEAQTMLSEREYLPPLAKHNLELYQRYLLDTEDLVRRVGMDPPPTPLASILAEFDVEFVGSRIEGTRPQRVQAYQTIFQQGANPYAAPFIPWGPSIKRFYRELGLYEEAAEVGQMIEQQTAIANQQPGNNASAGNGNGTQPAAPPVGLPPAQTAGTEVV